MQHKNEIILRYFYIQELLFPWKELFASEKFANKWPKSYAVLFKTSWYPETYSLFVYSSNTNIISAFFSITNWMTLPFLGFICIILVPIPIFTNITSVNVLNYNSSFSFQSQCISKFTFLYVLDLCMYLCMDLRQVW